MLLYVQICNSAQTSFSLCLNTARYSRNVLFRFSLFIDDSFLRFE